MRFYISGDGTESEFLRTLLESKGFQIYTPLAQETAKSDLKRDNVVVGKETYYEAHMRLSEKHQLRSVLLEQRMAVKWCDIFVLLLPADEADYVDVGVAVGFEKIIYTVGEPKGGKVRLSDMRGCYYPDYTAFMVAITQGGDNAK